MAASSSTLSGLGGTSYVSNAALAKILKNVKENPEVLDAGTSRWAVKRKREKDVRVSTVYGDLLQSMTLSLSSGESMDAWYVHPIVLLEFLCQSSSWFQRLMAATLQRHDGPLSLVWYADEVTPGNALRPLNHRKTFCAQEYLLHMCHTVWEHFQ